MTAKSYRSGIWVKFGTKLAAPVNIYSTVEDRSAETRLSAVCTAAPDGTPHDPTLAKKPYVCPTCQRTGQEKDFLKGKEIDGTVVVIGDADTVKVATEVDPMTKEELILTAHPLEEVLFHTIPTGKTYFMGPANEKKVKGFSQKQLNEAYALLLAAVKSSPDVALCGVFTLATKPTMFRIAMVGDVLTMTQLAWPNELKETPEVPGTAPEKVMAAMSSYVGGLVEEFDASRYVDTAAAARAELIAAADGTAAMPSNVVPFVPKVDSTDAFDAFLAEVEADEAPAPKKTRTRKAS